MPRVRRRDNFRQLSAFERGRIVGMREAGMALRVIANRLGRNASTVLRCWRSWTEEQRQQRRRGSGAVRRTNDREERLLRINAFRDRFSTSRSVANEWLAATGQRLSIRTVYRRIRSFGLQSYRPRLILPLTQRHRDARLQWCQERAQWDQEWNRVVFSDESRFCLWAHDGRRRVRRRRGERREVQYCLERETALTRGVTVWGAIAYGSRSPLVFLQGNLNAQGYINDILEPVTLPYLQELENHIFQQDNARPHTAAATTRFLHEANVRVLPWPAKSPDLSPIEHVWDKIGRRLGQLPVPPMNLQQLRNEIQLAWDTIPQEEINRLIRSMPDRVAECINLQGAPTHY